MTSKIVRTTLSLSAVFVALLAVGPIGQSTVRAQHNTVDLQILTVSDWRGQLGPLVTGATQIAGASVLSAYFQAERAANPNTLTLFSGDAFGATPPLSRYFDDVPAVNAMNTMGVDADTLSEHNFDAGVAALQQKINLATFKYLSANLRNRDANLTGVQDFQVFDVGGVKVAVVGVTNSDATLLTPAADFGTIQVTDPVAAANRARAAARRAGAKVFVAAIHAGVRGVDPATGLPYGPLIDFANNVGGFDVIVGDHTDVEYSGIHNNALVVENHSLGRTYARISLKVDPRNGHVQSRSAEFVMPLASAVTPDPAIVEMLGGYQAALPAILSAINGTSSVEIPRADACGRADGRLCESLVGDVTTDAMRAHYGTDFAITNSGGLRAALTCPAAGQDPICPPSAPPPHVITPGSTLSVLPFGNVVATLAVTGAELKAMLENGVSTMPVANGRFPQVSGLCFTYDISATAGSRVTGAVRQAGDGSCTGAPVDLTVASTYTLAENDFMAMGGDGYPNVYSRVERRIWMDHAVVDHVSAASPLVPLIQGRIACTSSGAGVCPS